MIRFENMMVRVSNSGKPANVRPAQDSGLVAVIAQSLRISLILNHTQHVSKPAEDSKARLPAPKLKESWLAQEKLWEGASLHLEPVTLLSLGGVSIPDPYFP